MKEMNKKEVKERLSLFHNNNIYTYIKNIYHKFFNGYIIEIKDDYIIFKDDYIGNIPIQIKEIEELEYSFRKKHE